MKDTVVVNPHKVFIMEMIEVPDVHLMMSQWCMDSIEDFKEGRADDTNTSGVIFGLSKKELFSLYQFLNVWFGEYLDKNEEWKALVENKKEENV